MDGLLRSEFALVLRDSLNSKPRRHALPTPPPPPPMSPSQKKPRSSSEFRIRCDMKLEPRLQFAPFPTSPTSPLPTSKLSDSPIPRAASSSTSSQPLPSPEKLGILRPDITPSSQTHRISKSKPSPLFAKRLDLISSTSPPTSPLASSVISSARPLDVLASVSAEQRFQIETPKSAPVLSSPVSSKESRRPCSLPSSPMHAASVTPITPIAPTAVDARKRKRKSTKNANQSGKSSSSGRVFSCSQCTSTFSQQFNLNKHVRAVHERRRPFECDVCHARFQQKSHRTMHHLAVHEKLRQFACDHCNASFSWRGVLKKHRKSIHGLDD